MTTKEWFYFSKRAEVAHMGTRWAKFYVFWRFPIDMVFTCIRILMPITDSLAPSTHVNVPYLTVHALINALYLILSILTYMNIKKFNITGYKFNMYLIWAFPILYAAFSQTNILDRPIMFASQALFVCILYSVPNYIYFKKRKFLFE